MVNLLFQATYFAKRCLIQSLNKYVPVECFPGRNCLLTFLCPQVLNLIDDQTCWVDQRIDALLLVGGFSGSEYLFKRVDVSH